MLSDWLVVDCVVNDMCKCLVGNDGVGFGLLSMVIVFMGIFNLVLESYFILDDIW